MPFPFDLSQVFWGLMNKTMWDCRLGNMSNGFNGFNTGFMNSCWGGGFAPQIAWGDSLSLSGGGGGGSSLTAEERVEKRKAEEKYTTLKGVIQDYIKSLNPTTDKDLKMLLEEKLKDCGSSYSEANYEKLTELYEEYKDKIQKKLNSNEGIKPSDKSKDAAKEFAKTTIDFKKILATEGEPATTKAELAKDVDAMGLLHSLQTNKTIKKTFKQVYTDALKGADTAKIQELKKVLEAVYSSLSKEALEVKKESGISEETTATLTQLSDIAAGSATVDNVEQLYYWIRMAKAEIADSKYACLQEEFPEFKQSNGVESTIDALEKEGLEPEKIKTQSVVTNYSDMENDTARMQSLETDNYVKALTSDQLKELNKYPEIKNLGIKKAWVDTSSIHNYQVIRFIDKDGNMRTLDGIGMRNGKIDRTGGEIKAIDSITPEQIKQRAATIASVTDATDALEEVTDAKSILGAAGKDVRVFVEKIATGDRSHPRVFFIDSEGNLKELPNIYYDKTNKIWITTNKAKQTETKDATVDEIKDAVASVTPEEELLNGKAIELAVWAEEGELSSLTPYENDKTGGKFRIWGGDKKLNDSTISSATSFKDLYNGNYCIELFTVGKRGIFEGDRVDEIANDKLTTLASYVVKSLAATGLKEDKLKTAADAVVKEWLTGINSDKDDVDDYPEIASGGCNTTEERKAGGSSYNKMAAENPTKLTIKRDGKGDNQAIGMISFKAFVDAILEKYKG